MKENSCLRLKHLQALYYAFVCQYTEYVHFVLYSTITQFSKISKGDKGSTKGTNALLCFPPPTPM